MKSKEEHIKYYISGGMRIFPCKSNGKSPLITGWQEKASTDQEIVGTWWDKFPHANIGAVTGKKANLVVVDVDVKKGARGMESLKQLQDECGQFDTRLVHTPSGGLHYYFSYPQGVDTLKNKANLMPGIDIRADGGLVIAPGSSIDGNPYEFEDIDKEIAELPKELLKILTEPKAKTTGFDTPVADFVYGVDDGTRDDSMFKLASRYIGIDMPYEEAKENILTAALNCNPPFPERKALKCLDSAYSSYEPNEIVATANQSLAQNGEYHLTQFGNADRMLDKHGKDIRYVAEFRTWIYWDGLRWRFDSLNNVKRMAKNSITSMVDSSRETLNTEQHLALARHAQRSENKSSIEGMLYATKLSEGLTISQSSLDQQMYLLGVSNGVVDLKSGCLKVNNRSDLITKQGFVEFRPEAECPLWLNFLHTIMGGDKEMMGYLQRIIGYSLTGNTSEQALFFLNGLGANGKSVLVKVIQKLLGDYASQMPIKVLTKRGNDAGVDDNLARLRGARFVATTETEEGVWLNESDIKLMTGQDILNAQFKYQDSFQYEPEFKIFMSGNHRPKIKGNDYGIWRRIRLIPFEVRIARDKQDKKLEDKLTTELSGILNWAIEGCLEWQELGLQTPKKVEDATKEYRSEMDIIKSWKADCCEPTPGVGVTTATKGLYSSFKHWADVNGERYVMSNKTFTIKLKEHGYVLTHTRDGNCFKGIALIELAEEPHRDS